MFGPIAYAIGVSVVCVVMSLLHWLLGKSWADCSVPRSLWVPIRTALQTKPANL
jgi:hypothetical protein